MPDPVISVRGLRKSYEQLEAVRGIDLEIAAGEIFAFLGPNGAGKTTTVEILEGYRERNAGDVEVLGRDPSDPSREWRERIGIVLQSCNLQPELTAGELLDLYAGYFPRPRPVGETLELVGLQDSSHMRSAKLSGGQQRRLDVALALIGDPELLFLDEPTTGFDPSARRQAWSMIANLRDLGKTVFLTTHYMEEAQRLADRVAIIARGEIVAQGSPDEIGGREQGASAISFRVPGGVAAADLPVEAQVNAGHATLSTNDPVGALNKLTAWALEGQRELDGLEVRRPSLEDVYLQLTGSEGGD